MHRSKRFGLRALGSMEMHQAPTARVALPHPSLLRGNRLRLPRGGCRLGHSIVTDNCSITEQAHMRRADCFLTLRGGCIASEIVMVEFQPLYQVPLRLRLKAC